MAALSPLNSLHQQAEASFLPYGPGPDAGPDARAASVVETFGELEGEYAALRKGCVLLDLPHRGVVRVTGKDRLDFLNRMVTQELKGLRAFQCRDSFWLSRKGRIDADLRLIELPDQSLVGVDLLAAARTASTLSDFVFSEDVQFHDATDELHHLALHGPTALRLAQLVSEHVEGPTLGDLGTGQATSVRIAGHPVVIDRQDLVGEVGLTLVMQAAHVPHVYQQLLERGLDENGHSPPAGSSGQATRIRLRPAGWHAFNIARIEAGTPVFNIDFGPQSFPAETGLLQRRVSFTKGCYLGQEVVARMYSLGHPKQVLVGLRVAPPAPAESDPSFTSPGQAAQQPPSPQPPSPQPPSPQPIAGAPIFRAVDGERTVVGGVTSSTRSPMLGDAIICLAALKWGAHEPGTQVLVEADAGHMPATVQPSLTFWQRAEASTAG